MAIKVIVAWVEVNTAALTIRPINLADGTVEQVEEVTTTVAYKVALEHTETTPIVNLLWINIKKTLQLAIRIKTQQYLTH